MIRIQPNEYFSQGSNLSSEKEVKHILVYQDQNGKVFLIVAVVAIAAIVCTTIVVLYKISKVR